MYGYVVFLNNQPVIWKSKLNPTVSLSSTEAEFVAVALSARDIQWLYHILLELGFIIRTSVIFCDNQGVLKIFKSESSAGKTRHVDIKLQYVKKLILTGQHIIRFVVSGDNVADVFTKPLHRLHFQKLISTMLKTTDETTKNKGEC